MNRTKENLLVANESDEREVALMESNSEVSSDILFEDTSKRSENVKYFRMSNGQYMAAVYDKPVHSVNDKTGKLEDIVRRFEETDEQYEAECNAYKAILPKKTGKRKFVTMERNGCSVSWRFMPRTTSHRKNPTAQIHRHERKVLTDLPVFPSATYADVDTGTSLTYSLSENGIKENIILTKRPCENRFRFELKTVGMKAILSEDQRSVSFIKDEGDGKESLMVIPPIQMTDEAGVYSEAAHYELEEEEGVSVLSVVVDPNWLFDDARIYPVTIDPQLLVHKESDIPLNFVTIRSDNKKWTATNTNRVGFERDGTENRMFARYSIPVLPSGYRLVDAILELNKSSHAGEDCGYNVYYVTDAWNNNTLSWENQPDLSRVRINGTIESDENDKVRIDLTRDIRKLNLSNSNTIGIAVKSCGACVRGCPTTYNSNDAVSHNYAPTSSSECGLGSESGGCQSGSSCSCHTCSNCEGYIDFYSSLKNSYGSPRIIVRYTLVDEYADHQQTESFNVGRAGRGSVNLFTGKLFYSHLDILPDRDILPLTLSHIYRSDFADANVTGVTYGKGWTLSAAQTLETSSDENVYAIYRDAQGRKHYFKTESITQEDDNPYKHADTAGLGLYYDGDSTIYDEKGNKLTFENGRLRTVSDSYELYNRLTYDDQNRLIRISDRFRAATLTYDSLGKLSYIMDAKGRKTSFVYNSTDDLIEIHYPDGCRTLFTYSNHRLTSVTDCSGIQYGIEYDSSPDSRVTKVTRTGTKTVTKNSVVSTSAVNGGGVAFDYRAISTAVKDLLTGIRTVYRYDECGRAVSSYEDLSENSSLAKGEITLTDLREYETAKDHKSLEDTTGKYTSVKTSISGTKEMNRNLLTNGSFLSDADLTLCPSGGIQVVSTASMMVLSVKAICRNTNLTVLIIRQDAGSRPFLSLSPFAAVIPAKTSSLPVPGRRHPLL